MFRKNINFSLMFTQVPTAEAGLAGWIDILNPDVTDVLRATLAEPVSFMRLK